MTRKILVAVDGSEPSSRAVDEAAMLAAGAEVLVLHVREREDLTGPGDGSIELETYDEARELVDPIVARLKDAGVSARGEVSAARIGMVARSIIVTARDEGADLIVAGSRGLSDWRSLVLGSVTHRLLHDAGLPVLVVP
jgi:nucleotide-binding universal stress UspA family protein